MNNHNFKETTFITQALDLPENNIFKSVGLIFQFETVVVAIGK